MIVRKNLLTPQLRRNARPPAGKKKTRAKPRFTRSQYKIGDEVFGLIVEKPGEVIAHKWRPSGAPGEMRQCPVVRFAGIEDPATCDDKSLRHALPSPYPRPSGLEPST